MAADITGVQAYQAAIRAAQQATNAPSQDETPGLDFGNLVTNAVNETASTLQNAEQMTAAAAMGDAELVDVVTAVSAAELTLETVVAVRDEVVRAYQEILRMPI
jgi:flagellar hook-basal body complex protein FliE